MHYTISIAFVLSLQQDWCLILCAHPSSLEWKYVMFCPLICLSNPIFNSLLYLNLWPKKKNEFYFSLKISQGCLFWTLDIWLSLLCVSKDHLFVCMFPWLLNIFSLTLPTIWKHLFLDKNKTVHWKTIFLKWMNRERDAWFFHHLFAVS